MTWNIHNAFLSYIMYFCVSRIAAGSDLADLALRAARGQTALAALGVIADHVLDCEDDL
jgi:hypothetical protein